MDKSLRWIISLIVVFVILIIPTIVGIVDTRNCYKSCSSGYIPDNYKEDVDHWCFDECEGGVAPSLEKRDAQTIFSIIMLVSASLCGVLTYKLTGIRDNKKNSTNK